MTISITLTDKQQAAFDKRISTGTAKEFAATIITDQAQAWADADYSASAAALTEALKDQPQAVLDGVIAQLQSLAK